MKKPNKLKNIFSKSKALVGAALLTAIITGCGDSREEFVITNTNNIAAPAAVDDSFAALGNATLNQAAANGVLGNDVPNGAAISAFDAVGSQNGTIVLNADGSFTYTPVAGFVGTETFTYTLSNNAGSSTATVTLTSTALGRFVDNSQAQNGTGTQASPFNNLADAVNAAQNGDTIFVSRGDGTNNNLTGGITLPAGVDLVGEGAGLVAAQTIVPPGQQPVIEGPIDCGGDNNIRGLNINGSASDLIVVNGFGNVTVSDNTLQNPGAEFIDCDNTTGTVTISGNDFLDPSNNDEHWLIFENDNTNGSIVVTNNTFDNVNDQDTDDICQIFARGTSDLTVNFSDNVADGDSADEFDGGLFVVALDTGDITVTVADNLFDNFERAGIITQVAIGATLTGTISGNTISNVSNGEGMVGEVNNGTMTISGNTILDVVSDGLVLLSLDAASNTFVVSNNNITNAGADSIDIGVGDGGGDLNVALRNNTTVNSNDDAVVIESFGNGDACLDIFGNTFDDNLVILNNGTGTYSVERLDANNGGPLNAQGVNTFTGGAPSTAGGGTFTPVAAGFCQIP